MIIDIIVLIVLLISAGIAFIRGFIREVLTIAGVVGGLAAAYMGGPHLSVYMRGWLGVDPEAETPQKLFDIIPYTLLADILSYGAIFIIVVIVLSIISHVLAESVKSIGLGAVDRTLGVIFGLLRGIILLGILYLPAYALIDKETRDGWFSGSRTHFYIEKTAGVLSEFLPDDTMAKTEDSAKKQTQETLENMNILPKKDANNSSSEGTDEQNSKPSGYDENFRQKMDELFEQGKNRKPSAYNP